MSRNKTKLELLQEIKKEFYVCLPAFPPKESLPHLRIMGYFFDIAIKELENKYEKGSKN